MSAKEQTTKRKKLSGVVDSVKMTDTAVVVVSSYYRHPRYGKFIKTQKRYKAHNENNTAKVGDEVIIEETKPISKDKRFKIVK
ncbi:MAG: 30S ribosomal protein S17 [Candidatus Paceibacterota bacterium]